MASKWNKEVDKRLLRAAREKANKAVSLIEYSYSIWNELKNNKMFNATKIKRKITLEQYTLFVEWIIRNAPDTVFSTNEPAYWLLAQYALQVQGDGRASFGFFTGDGSTENHDNNDYDYNVDYEVQPELANHIMSAACPNTWKELLTYLKEWTKKKC